MSGTNILKHPIHLGRGATAVVEPAFTGDMAWYQGYTAVRCNLRDGTRGGSGSVPRITREEHLECA